MLRWNPMVRATSLLAGPPIVFDLAQISTMTSSEPGYPPIARDVETVHHVLRRKNFGSRPTAELAFEVTHSSPATIEPGFTVPENALARYEELSGNQLLGSRSDLSDPAIWPQTTINVFLSSASAARVIKDAERVEWATYLIPGAVNWAHIASRANDAGSLAFHAGKTALASLWYRDVGTVARRNLGLVIGNENPATSPSQSAIAVVTPKGSWRKVTAQKTFTPDAGLAERTWLLIYPNFAGAAAGAGAEVAVWNPMLQEIVRLPGSDEEILADLFDKLCDDDWSIELTLDGGLTWRQVLLMEHEKSPLENKWIGHSIRFLFEATGPIQRRPAALDGRW